MNIDKSKKYLDSLLEFIWVKISEKYTAVAQAFRFFDVQNVIYLNIIIIIYREAKYQRMTLFMLLRT